MCSNAGSTVFSLWGKNATQQQQQQSTSLSSCDYLKKMQCLEPLERLLLVHYAERHARLQTKIYTEWVESFPYFLHHRLSVAISERTDLGLMTLNALEYRRNYEAVQGEARLRCYSRCDCVVFILTVLLGFFFFAILFYGLLTLAEPASKNRDSFYYRRHGA
jgi:hypothetical protein